MVRSSGIIMHIASLPGDYGIGTFGKEAYKFADFLKKSGQRYWQILPLGQTSYGDSPYQSFSAFAGNPYFIDFDILNEEGILDKSDYENVNFGSNPEDIDYGTIFIEKLRVLRTAFEKSRGRFNDEIERFRQEQNLWIHDYALYMSVKGRFNLVGWQNWADDIKRRDENALEYYRHELRDDIEFWTFVQ